ncbi:Zinc knuckle CX2CX4HX4C [Sesbania bispinosa]|nr:Zinc knuckle CX2CX4HX4C [Sesbania bispinosa]
MSANLIVFDKEDIQEGVQDCKNSVIGRLLTEKSVHVNSLSNALNSIWNAPKGFKVINMGEKLFQIFFEHEKEADRVVKGSPWVFRNSWLVLHHWVRGVQPSELSFHHVPVWMQIWGLPIHCRTKQMGQRIGSCMGEVLESHVHEIQGRGSFVKAPFERLPQFCYQCGVIGHDDDGCNGDKDEEDADHPRGPWMRASQAGRAKALAQELLEKLSTLTVHNPKPADPNPPPPSDPEPIPTPKVPILETLTTVSPEEVVHPQEKNLCASPDQLSNPYLKDISNTQPDARTKGGKWKRLRITKQPTGGKENSPITTDPLKCKAGNVEDVRNGFHVKVWDDGWLPLYPGYKPHEPRPNKEVVQRVFDLIDPATYLWNSSLLDEFFLPNEAEQIRCIPLPTTIQEDKFCWGVRMDRVFTVRSGYHFAMQELNSIATDTANSHTSSDCNWKKLWSFKAINANPARNPSPNVSWPRSGSQVEKWFPPPHHWYKLNVDAAHAAGEVWGIG